MFIIKALIVSAVSFCHLIITYIDISVVIQTDVKRHKLRIHFFEWN